MIKSKTPGIISLLKSTAVYLFISFLFCLEMIFLQGCDKPPVERAGREHRQFVFGQKPVAIGDSWTARGEYAERLSELIGIPVINKGKSGETALGGSYRLDEIAALNPTSVIIEYGINDGDTDNLQEYQSGLRFIAEFFTGKKIPAMLLTVPSVKGNDFKGFNRIVLKIAREYNVSICDINKLVFDEFKSDLYIDNNHANKKGYRLMAEAIYNCR